MSELGAAKLAVMLLIFGSPISGIVGVACAWKNAWKGVAFWGLGFAAGTVGLALNSVWLNRLQEQAAMASVNPPVKYMHSYVEDLVSRLGAFGFTVALVIIVIIAAIKQKLARAATKGSQL